jgi:hypothetical protein
MIGVPTKALQNFFLFQKQRCMIKDLKLKILNTPYLTIPLLNWDIFAALEAIGGGLKIIL